MLEKPKINIFQKYHSPLKAILILIFSILISEFCIKYFFIGIPVLAKFDIPIINALILLTILLPILYYFVYKPMRSQCKRLESAEEIQRELSLLDVLTGLYNRRGFILYANHLLKVAIRSKKALLLVYADIDNMKWINDHLGHEGGDKAIVSIAKVLTVTFRGSDVIGRVGGDEFAILFLESKEENTHILRNRLNKKLQEAERNFKPKCGLKLSVGIAANNPGESKSIEDLMEQADTRMYDEKRTRHDV
ncbi:MAG: GGDEF domain-containing protein [Candidatus Omnitrophica bacterium]|nr:GGDEF domain-containing protein [Candidatus Omnitrophota bacterium]